MPKSMHKNYFEKGNIVSGYSGRQRKGSDRDHAGEGRDHSIIDNGSVSNMPGAKETEYPESGKKVKGTGRLPAAGGGYE